MYLWMGCRSLVTNYLPKYNRNELFLIALNFLRVEFLLNIEFVVKVLQEWIGNEIEEV